jgi:hypothetical protein
MVIYVAVVRNSADSRKSDFISNEYVLFNKTYDLEEKENQEIGYKGLGNGCRVHELRLVDYAATKNFVQLNKNINWATFRM